MDKLSENPLSYLTKAFEAMTKWAKEGQNQDEKPVFNWEMFNLDNLVSCFPNINKENFLSETPLENYLASIDPDDFSLHDDLPEGVRITATVVPCDVNGLLFEQKYLDDTKNNIYPYFQLYYSNPTQNNGMAIGGSGGFRAAPYLKAIPEEIKLQCSFVVEYSPGNERQEGETDYEYFCRMMRKSYKRLQELVKGRMPS